MHQTPLVLWSQKPFWRMMGNGKWAPGRERGRCTMHLLRSFRRGGLGLERPDQSSRLGSGRPAFQSLTSQVLQTGLS